MWQEGAPATLPYCVWSLTEPRLLLMAHRVAEQKFLHLSQFKSSCLGGWSRAHAPGGHPAQGSRNVLFPTEQELSFSKVLRYISVQKYKTLIINMAQMRSGGSGDTRDTGQHC